MANIFQAFVFLLFLFTLIRCPDPYEANPFFVDESTVIKGDYKWEMKLKNHHQASEDTSNPEIMLASVSIQSLDSRVLQFKMTDANSKRWEVKLANPSPGKDYKHELMSKMGFEYENDPFGFKIVDPSTKEVVVSTLKGTVSSLKFFHKYLEFGMWFPHKRAFGLGERVTPQFELCTTRQWCVYTIFSKDEASPVDNGDPPGGRQVYGHQPFYMIQLKSGLFIGVLVLNSNDQDAVLVKYPGDPMNVYHKMIGGIFDVYYFYPGSADNVLKKYHGLIGKPYLPPLWSLGFHQCRYGWPDLNYVKGVVAKFDEYDIPLEVVWADIDYMKNYADFTIDEERYGGLGEFVKTLHSKAMKWVPIIDAGLKYDKKDKYFKLGEEHGAFIKSAFTRKTLIGKVWPGYAVFPDWLEPYATTLWHIGLGDLYEQAQFDGIWIDMNEVSNFCDGECTDVKEKDNLRQSQSIGPDPHDPREFDDLPYVPGSKDPNNKALSMTGYHKSTDDDDDRLNKEFNLHSLWCVTEAKATNSFFVQRKKRPFVLTRSSFPGSGLFTSKWLGDNFSLWEFMRYSIGGMYNFQMFGMPLVGADMCGFILNTTEELCARWMQMGSFYPFSRNHNAIGNKDQEPYVFGERVAKASRNAIRQKYSILRYYYTKLFEVSLEGGSLVKPLFFEYPNDEKAYGKTDFTFMIGNAVMVAPVLFPGYLESYPYLTNENWFDLFGRNQLYAYDPAETEGKEITLAAGFEFVPVLLRGGYIIPFQDALLAKARRTEVLKVLPMEIIVAPDHLGVATGTIIVDDGDSLAPIENGEYRYLKLNFSKTAKKLTIEILHDYSKIYQFENFSSLSILGIEDWSDIETACISDRKGNVIKVGGRYDSRLRMLTFSKKTTIPWKDIATIDFSC